MEVLYILVPVAILLAGVGVTAFRWAVRDGQFDDLESPAFRILFDETAISPDQANGAPRREASKGARHEPQNHGDPFEDANDLPRDTSTGQHQ